MSLIKKTGIWLLSFLAIIIGLAYVIFFLNRDFIKDEIVHQVNKSIKGEIALDKVGLRLIADFPRATLRMQGVQLWEQKADSKTSNRQPLVQLAELNVSLNVAHLLDDKLTIEKIRLANGRADIINYTDNSINLLNAISLTTTDTVDNPEEQVSLHLNSIEAENVSIHHHDETSNQYLATTVNLLESSLLIDGDSVNGAINLDFQLDSLLIEGIALVRHHQLNITTDFDADINNLALAVDRGKIKIDLLEADLAGYYNLADSGYVDFTITAEHSNLADLAGMELFDPEYVPDIRAGELVLNASVKGKTMGQIPVVTTEARLSGLHVHNHYGDVIEDSGFRLNYFSGSEEGLRDGFLYIDSVALNFASGGYLTGELEITNFSEPAYKINYQFAEDLTDLKHIFHFADIEDMQGVVRSQARLKGTFDLPKREFSNPQGIFRAQFENCRFAFKDDAYLLTDVNGQLFMNEGAISFDNISFNANGNELQIDSRVRNLLPYLLGADAELTGRLSLHTHSLNTHTLLAFDPALQKDINYKVDSIDLVVQGVFQSVDIDSFILIPTGSLEIKNLTAKVDNLPLINKVKGNVFVRPDTLALAGFTGFVGQSRLEFDLHLINYDGYFQTDSLENMVINLDLNSEELIAKDFFTINKEFVLPKSYAHEILKNVSFNSVLTISNFELQKTSLLPEFGFQITGLKFQTHFSPVKFRDIAIFGLIKDNNIYINSLFGKLGRSDVFMNAEFNNVLATKDTISRPVKSRISINSQLLDLDELIKLGKGDTDHRQEESEPTTENPYADDYPITDLSVNIGELDYFGARIKNLSGILNMEDHNIIRLNKVKLQAGEYGSFEFEGVFDASSHREAILTSNIKIADVDLSKLDVTYVQDGTEVKIGDHLQGTFNGEIEASVPILQDFNFDLSRLTGSIKAIVKNGALVNYAPLQELSKYFKNKDLNKVYFADLMNTMVFDQGKMHLPFMTINTTLGTIMLMGYQTIDGEMEFDIQVPVKMVAGAVLNSLFAAKKGDDSKQDQISSGPKGKYITVHVYGTPDEYQFKIGKKHGQEAIVAEMEQSGT